MPTTTLQTTIARQEFIAQSGATYISDANALVVVDNNDLASMLTAGCVFPGTGFVAGRNNIGAAVDPTSAADSAAGYAIGSTWINTTAGKTWVCTSAVVNTAVWIQTGPGTGTFGLNLPLTSGRTVTGLTLDATGGAALFHIASTVGTSLALAGNAANSATITSSVIFEVQLPKTYVAGANITVTVNGLVAGAGTTTTKTLTVLGYLIANAGTEGSNIGPVAQSLTTSAADYNFTLTGTTLTPGARVLLELVTVLTETAGTNSNTQINSIRLA